MTRFHGRIAKLGGSVKCLVILAALASNGYAVDELAPAPASPSGARPPGVSAGKGAKVDVEAVKRKYWAQGNESEMSVVQNRLYTKAGKFEFGIFYANQVGDPFLVIRDFGALGTYHMTEEWGLTLYGWKSFVSNSTAYTAFVNTPGFPGDTNSDRPKYFIAGEVMFSPIYGKLSLIGKAILYYDMHVMAGMGRITQENGSYFAPTVGIGQQIYLNKSLALRIDYRWITYSETIINKQTSAVSDRRNYTDAISLGVDMMF
jgi:outer membrane beta-barrel protein